MPHKGDTTDTVYFYEQEFYVLSNFSAFRLYWRDLDFDTSEHAYQWEKFWVPTRRHQDIQAAGHQNIQAAIHQARSAHEAFKIAEANRPHVREGWEAQKTGVMRAILRTKAAQHEYVRRKLLETGDRTLIEDSWRDAFWGWGADRQGQNMLGKLSMEIRAELHKPSGQTAEAVTAL